MSNGNAITLKTQEIFAETRVNISAVPGGSAAYVVGFAIAGTAFDLYSPESSNASLNIAQTVACYYLLLAMMRARNLLPEHRGTGYFSYLERAFSPV